MVGQEFVKSLGCDTQIVCLLEKHLSSAKHVSTDLRINELNALTGRLRPRATRVKAKVSEKNEGQKLNREGVGHSKCKLCLAAVKRSEKLLSR